MQTSEPNISTRARTYADWFAGVGLFLLTLVVYLRTLAPSVAFLFDDSLEFQLLASRMAIAHPTGYPLYSLLIKLATFLPLGDVAYRVNLVSALSGAGTVLFVYLASRLVTERFMTANNAVGEVLTRVPAVVAALLLAFGQTFWSQAVIAEVYAVQAFLTALLFWLVLRWGSLPSQRVTRYNSLLPIAFLAGLMLTHHRMSVLLVPALVVYVLSYDRTVLKQPLTLFKIVAAFLVPLLLYLYIPIRGTVTSSLDGAYQNTPEGFLNWILGTAYTVFVTQNPFNQTRDAGFYFDLIVSNLSAWGVLAGLGGFVALFLRAWREWLLIVLALAANLVFVLTYQVTDINVFFIPTFVIAALLSAAGLSGLLWAAYYALPNRAAVVAAALGALLLLLLPLNLYRENYPQVDLSNKTDVLAYGKETLAAPLPPNATIIGILGEMTLLRYLQETQNMNPAIETIAADKEQDRLLAVEEALKRERAVFLTRPLKDIEKKNSLASVGPLIEVQARPNRGNPPTPAQPLDADFGDVKLLGYARGADSERYVPVTLYWQPQAKIPDARLVSLKLIDANGILAGQLDRQPVLDAYPTNAWRNGEYVVDSYEVPIFVGAAPGEYTLQATLYNPESGKVFGQSELGKVNVSAQTENVPRELLGMTKTTLHDLGGVELSGYDLETSEPYTAGADVALTLLWRMRQGGTARAYQVTVADEFGKVVQTQDGSVGGADTQAGQYVRQQLGFKLPTTLAPGKYNVRVGVKGGLPLPFQTNTLTLGTLQVAPP